MPFSRSASVSRTSAKRLGDGTTYLKRIGGWPKGKLPEISTFCVPSGFGCLATKVMFGSESGFPVVVRLVNVTYEVTGDDVNLTGPPCAQGVTITSMMLSLTTIGDMTTPVPSSRAPS